MSFASHLRRALFLAGLFAVRFAAAGPAGLTSLSITLGDFENQVLVGKPTSITVSITSTTPTEGHDVCSDDAEGGGGWGCNSEHTCSRYTYEPGIPIEVTAPGTILEATCDENCEVTRTSAGTLSLTGKTANTIAKLHLRAQDEAGNSVTRDISIAVNDDQLRLARYGETQQTPENAFLVGQTFAWCVLGGESDRPLDARVDTFGSIETTGAISTPTGCKAFRTQTVGTSHVAFTLEDGRSVTADVVTVAPSDVTAIDFIDLEPRNGSTALATGEVIATAPTLDDVGCYTQLARFETRDGLFGLVPEQAIKVDARSATARLGPVTRTASLPSGCY